MSEFRVLVTDTIDETLAAGRPLRYASPPQPEAQARSLIGILIGHPAVDTGPWRRPVAGGQRLIELERDANPAAGG
jgi:hypothetical protein